MTADAVHPMAAPRQHLILICQEGFQSSLAAATPPTPEQYKSLLGLYTPADMTTTLRLEWRDGKLVFVEPGSTDSLTEIQPVGIPDTFTAVAGNLISGETVEFRRLANGRVGSVFFGSATLLRLDPPPAEDLVAD